MKVNSKIYKGIEYIQLTDLPNEQQDLIIQHLEEDDFIKILVENSVISDCIQYKDYEAWFDTIFRKPTNKNHSAPEASPVLRMVFGKA